MSMSKTQRILFIASISPFLRLARQSDCAAAGRIGCFFLVDFHEDDLGFFVQRADELVNGHGARCKLMDDRFKGLGI